MKWFALVCLFICSTVSESRYMHKRDAEHHTRHIGGIYKTVGENNLKAIVLVMVAQNLQKCSLEEHSKLRENIMTFAKHCVDHEEEEECKKPMLTQFYDHICKVDNIGQTYPWIPECCTKEDPERFTCFIEHRDIKAEPYKRPEVESACKEHKDDPQHAFDHYTEQISIRHSSLYPPVVLALAFQYNTIVTECCAAEDKQKCFEDRLTEVAKKTHYIERLQKQTCRILAEFPERTFQAYKLARISQKYPGASFEDIYKLTLEVVHLNKDCCKADVVECMVERLEFTQHTCDHHEKLSSKLKGCCEKSVLERASCILALPNDDVPADLPKELKEFVEDEHVCKHYEEKKDTFLAEFTYQFARRHGELAPLSLLRIAKSYQEILEKCCATENPPECYRTAPQLLDAAIQEIHKLEKENCGFFQDKGSYLYQIELLNRYTRKMPQVSAETLIEITGEMTKIAAKCCALPEDQRIPCAEDKLDILIGETCERQSNIFINENVRKCCTESYANRRPCFTKMGPDHSYKPPQPDETDFHLSADICDASEEKQQRIKKILLINVLKLKCDLAQEKVEELIKEFAVVTKKCCEDANHQACFDLEKPKLLLHVKTAIAH